MNWLAAAALSISSLWPDCYAVVGREGYFWFGPFLDEWGELMPADNAITIRMSWNGGTFEFVRLDCEQSGPMLRCKHPKFQEGGEAIFYSSAPPLGIWHALDVLSKDYGLVQGRFACPAKTDSPTETQ